MLLKQSKFWIKISFEYDVGIEDAQFKWNRFLIRIYQSISCLPPMWRVLTWIFPNIGDRVELNLCFYENWLNSSFLCFLHYIFHKLTLITTNSGISGKAMYRYLHIFLPTIKLIRSVCYSIRFTAAEINVTVILTLAVALEIGGFCSQKWITAVM